MSYRPFLTGVKTSGSMSADAQATNAIRLKANIGYPVIHNFTFAARGDFADALVWLVLGASASVTASAAWIPIADSTITFLTSGGAVKSFDLPDDSYVGIVMASTSTSTSVDILYADNYWTG